MTTKVHVWGYAEGCPSCTNLKSLFDLLRVPYQFHDIDRNSPERAALRDAGFYTVPQVFTPEGLHLGDFSTYRKVCLAATETLLSPSGQV